MSMIDWWKKVVMANYANFEGRARRSEYWYFLLANALLYIGCIIIAGIGLATEIGAFVGLGYLAYIGIALGLFVPSLAVFVRRLHDTNHSGWWILIAFVPLVGPIILIVFLASEGTRGPNQYGPDPKAVAEDSLAEHLVS